jgi:hypothetical protein
VDRGRLVSGIDVLPTVCGYSGVPVPVGVEGINLKPLIDNPSLPGRDHVVVEVGPIGGDPEDWENGGNGRIIRTARWKYARFDSREETLFDMDADPDETRNLAGAAALAPVLAKHRRTLEEYVRMSGDHFRMEGLNRSKPQTEFPGEDPNSDEPVRLTRHPGYPNRPDGTEELDRFAAPANWGDDYGSRLSGFLHPSKTEDYFFFLNCANAGQLWLSPGKDPAKKVKVASVAAGVPRGKWKAQPRAASGPVRLKAGGKYWIEVLHHAGKGDDHVSVAWWSTGTGWQAPIPGNFLSTPDGHPGRIRREYWRVPPLSQTRAGKREPAR